MTWMQTYTGKAWYPMTPRSKDVDIEDIAHALSHLCRYGGHCRRFYSVAEHSVLVSRLVRPEHALLGLMHDASEAYVVDVPRPLKVHLGNYHDMESRAWIAIALRFDLPYEMPADVHRADIDACFIERGQLMAPVRHAWMDKEWGMGHEFSLPAPPSWVWELGFDPEKAEVMFMNRFEELTK
jgi:uncharacterized protein